MLVEGREYFTDDLDDLEQLERILFEWSCTAVRTQLQQQMKILKGEETGPRTRQCRDITQPKWIRMEEIR
jgi:hypothetical protein